MKAQGVISASAKRGLRLFVGAGHCDLCHAGSAFTDGQFHNLGLPMLPGRQTDTGRAAGIRLVREDPFNAAGQFSDAPQGDARERLAYLPAPTAMAGAFKTPSLRNVALTAPYMHDGRFATLDQVLEFYMHDSRDNDPHITGIREKTLQLVPRLRVSQKSDLIAFLKTLSAQAPPAQLMHAP